MNSQGIPTVQGVDSLSSTRPKSWPRWSFALALCLYYLLAYLFLAKAIPIFGKLFEGLEVELPLPTRLLMANYSWLFPLLFVPVVILAVAKQFLALKELPLRIVNWILILVGVVFVPLVVFTLYLPSFILFLKLFK